MPPVTSAAPPTPTTIHGATVWPPWLEGGGGSLVGMAVADDVAEGTALADAVATGTALAEADADAEALAAAWSAISFFKFAM